MLHHLSRKHDIQHQECMKLRSVPSMSHMDGEKSSQISIKETFARGTAYDKKSKLWVEVTSAITIHLTRDMVQLSTVEKDGFREMIKMPDPRYGMLY